VVRVLVRVGSVLPPNGQEGRVGQDDDQREKSE